MLPGGTARQCNVGLPLLGHRAVELAMGTLTTGCGLALVNGDRFGQHQRELPPFGFVVCLVLEGSRPSRYAHCLGLVVSAPAIACFPLEFHPNLRHLACVFRVDVRDDAASAVHELVLDVDVEAEHDANAHRYLEQPFQPSCVLWFCPRKFRLQR